MPTGYGRLTKAEWARSAGNSIPFINGGSFDPSNGERILNFIRAQWWATSTVPGGILIKNRNTARMQIGSRAWLHALGRLNDGMPDDRIEGGFKGVFFPDEAFTLNDYTVFEGKASPYILESDGSYGSPGHMLTHPKTIVDVGNTPVEWLPESLIRENKFGLYSLGEGTYAPDGDVPAIAMSTNFPLPALCPINVFAYNGEVVMPYALANVDPDSGGYIPIAWDLVFDPYYDLKNMYCEHLIVVFPPGMVYETGIFIGPETGFENLMQWEEFEETTPDTYTYVNTVGCTRMMGWFQEVYAPRCGRLDMVLKMPPTGGQDQVYQDPVIQSYGVPAAVGETIDDVNAQVGQIVGGFLSG